MKPLVNVTRSDSVTRYSQQLRMWQCLVILLHCSIRSAPRGLNWIERIIDLVNKLNQSRSHAIEFSHTNVHLSINPILWGNRDHIIVVIITLVTNVLRPLRGKIFCQLYKPLECTFASWPEGKSLSETVKKRRAELKTYYSIQQLASGNQNKTAM